MIKTPLKNVSQVTSTDVAAIPKPRTQRTRLATCLGFVALLVLAFIKPLIALMIYAAGNALHPHIVLIPFVSAYFFNLTGTPVLRHGVVFQLPGITIEVAQECSGIRSSWVLFITSLVASHMFLKSPWRRAILVAFVIPLGVIRNGFRILVIGLL